MTPHTHDWVAFWRELAAATAGVEKGSPLFSPVMAYVDRAEQCYKANQFGGAMLALIRLRKVRAR